MVPVPDDDQVRLLTSHPPRLAFEDVLVAVSQRRAELRRPISIGVSGYGGSGKSTIARRLESALPEAYRLRGDDFLDPPRSHVVSSDWDGVDRERLVSTVLEPFRRGAPARFRRFDWSRRTLGRRIESLPKCEYLLVDLVGLFHPEVLPVLDTAIWVDVDLATATTRGKARDSELGRSHEHLWDGVWVPNERSFDQRFEPRRAASLLVQNPDM